MNIGKNYVHVSTHPSGVVQDFGIRPAIVGRVGVGVVAQSGKHGGDDSHVPHHISWDLPHPLGQGLHIDRLDDLVCRSLNPNKRKTNVCFSLRYLLLYDTNVS